jgi:hypothetical protein
MFGDLVLRLPDIVHSIYDKNKDWQLLIGWCYWFCKESGVFDDTNGKLLHLVCTVETISSLIPVQSILWGILALSLTPIFLIFFYHVGI